MGALGDRRDGKAKKQAWAHCWTSRKEKEASSGCGSVASQSESEVGESPHKGR